MNNYKAIFLSSSEANSYDSTISLAKWSLRSPLRFTTENSSNQIQSWPPTQVKVQPQIAVHSMSYINYFVNISAALANNHIYFSDDPLDPTKYDIVIPDGSYDILSLNAYIGPEQIVLAGVQPFDLLPNYTLNKCYIEFLIAGWYVHFPVGGSALLGFTAGNKPVGMASLLGEICVSENTPQFNNVETVGVSTNLSNDSLGSFGGTGLSQSNIIYTSVPSTPIGYTVKDQPTNLLWVVSDTLSGSVSEIIVQLLSQNGTPINLAGENFNIVLSIKY